MSDKRRYERLFTDKESKAVVSCASLKEEGQILDMSVGGMRVAVSKPMDVGTTVYGQFNVLNFPYYIRGTVNRLEEARGEWELAISFEKVSSLPLQS